MSKRAEEAAEEYFRGSNPYREHPEEEWEKEGFISGYEQAEKDLGWHSVEESLPPVNEEVIVLADRLNLGSLFAIAFGHIVNTDMAVDYDGWNIPGVKFWMPLPKIPNEE